MLKNFHDLFLDSTTNESLSECMLAMSLNAFFYFIRSLSLTHSLTHTLFMSITILRISTHEEIKTKFPPFKKKLS